MKITEENKAVASAEQPDNQYSKGGQCHGDKQSQINDTELKLGDADLGNVAGGSSWNYNNSCPGVLENNEIDFDGI